MSERLSNRMDGTLTALLSVLSVPCRPHKAEFCNIEGQKVEEMVFREFSRTGAMSVKWPCLTRDWTAAL